MSPEIILKSVIQIKVRNSTNEYINFRIEKLICMSKDRLEIQVRSLSHSSGCSSDSVASGVTGTENIRWRTHQVMNDL